MSGRRGVTINDVCGTYFYDRATRDIYIEIPAEDEDARPNVLGKLALCFYGIRDAAKDWQETLSAQLEACGFCRGIGHPAMLWHPERNIMSLVHGDDYVSSGRQLNFDWMEVQLQGSFEIQTQKLGLDKGCVKEGKVLNRIVCCGESGRSLEADPRHAEQFRVKDI